MSQPRVRRAGTAAAETAQDPPGPDPADWPVTDRSVASADPPVTVGAPGRSEPPAPARLPPIMETMHAAGRRKLPPVPRNGTEPESEPEQPRDPAQQFVARLRSAA